jgi:hypothetical protein
MQPPCWLAQGFETRGDGGIGIAGGRRAAARRARRRQYGEQRHESEARAKIETRRESVNARRRAESHQ